MMKVFKNEINVYYGGGCALVAANNAEEAHCILAQSEEAGYMFNEYDEECNHLDNPSDWKCEEYPKENWEVVDHLTYDGDSPVLIFVHAYQE